jgi:hypothetical protein
MFSNSRYPRRFFRSLVSLVATGLVVVGLGSCGGSGSSGSSGATGSTPTLTLSPSTMKLTAGGSGQQASLLLTAPGSTSAATVTVSGLPAGVSISPATLSLTPGTALTVTLTAAASAATSTAAISFSSTIGGQAVSTQGSLVVQGAVADFSLSVMPTSVSLPSNGTPSTVSVLATAINGFSGSVSVAISGLPSGVTAKPTSLTLTPGTAASLSLAAAAGTAAESGTVTLTGTSVASTTGSPVLTHSATLAVSVVAPPPAQADFSLAVTPQSLSLTVGAAGQPVQLSATALDGLSGTVSVAVSGLPAGVTASPASLTLTPGTPQSVTLAAGNSAQPGSANVVFTGTSGALSHAATQALTVAAAGVNVTTYHNDNARDGWYSAETVLTPQNVNATTFGKLTELPVDGLVDAQPLYVSGLSIAGQVHNVLITVTENDSAYAFDPDSGTQLWKVSALGSGEVPSDNHGCGQITPTIGITDTPVIDRSQGANGAVYFVAMSKDASNNYHQRLHALDLATGAELTGSPSEIQAQFPGTGYGSTSGNQVFDPGQYAERVGLLLMNGELYLAWTSHCDDDPYTGWLMAYSETTLQQTGVLNLTPNGPSTPHFGNGEGSVWMAGAGLAGDTEGNIFFLDANGSFDSSLNANGFPAQGDFGNSFMKVSTTGNVLTAADYFAAYNLQSESDADQDLGSGGALLLPDLVDAGGTTHHLAVGAGKDTNIYVVDRDNMGKFNASSNNAVYQEIPDALSGGAFSMATYFNNTVYYAGVGDYLKAFPITNALLATTPAGKSANTFAYPGSTPSVSSNGSQNGIIWAVENQSGAGVLHAYNPASIATELYDSNQAANSRDHFTDNKFITPMIANGKVYVGTPTSVAVFGLLP